MELYANELSIDGQFPSLEVFRRAMLQVVQIRQRARAYGRELHCNRQLVTRVVAQGVPMQKAINQAFNKDEQRSLMQWLTRGGPFWEDGRSHSPNDLFECDGVVVTDTSIAEAASACSLGRDCRTVSLVPSAWASSPLAVERTADTGVSSTVNVTNHSDPDEVESALRQAEPLPDSWGRLAECCRLRCPGLRVADDCFLPLSGHPFSHAAARRILDLMLVLDRIKASIDDGGKMASDGECLYRDRFVGERAWFSDSSDSEKSDFGEALNFPHPDKPGEYLFCSWHGKVSAMTLRLHFSWPIAAGSPLYVAYVGPKITKR